MAISGTKSPKRWSDGLIWLGVAVVVVAFVAYGYGSTRYHREHAVRADGCLAYVPPPAVLVVIDDATDKLTGAQPRRWRATVAETIDKLPAASRVLFTQIGATVPAEAAYRLTLCVPPRGHRPRQRALRSRLNQALNEEETALENAHTLPRSPIAGTIVAVAADPMLQGIANKQILVESDLLQNAGGATAYRRGGLILPATAGRPLQGFHITFSLLENVRDRRFQTPKLVRTWVEWARAAGATPTVDAPLLGLSSQQVLVRAEIKR